jgi:hypothetical protein
VNGSICAFVAAGLLLRRRRWWFVAASLGVVVYRVQDALRKLAVGVKLAGRLAVQRLLLLGLVTMRSGRARRRRVVIGHGSRERGGRGLDGERSF